MNSEQGPTGALPRGPVTETERILSLDLIRGVAVLGILLMNAVSFRFGLVAYRNVSAEGSEIWIDWVVGILGEILIDQKFMGIFSLLFGAGIFLFIERASMRERRPTLLNAWRNVLLLVMGLIHMTMWEGDVLTLYAISAFVLLILHRLPSRIMVVLGVIIFVSSVIPALITQCMANTMDVSLAGNWTLPEGGAPGEGVQEEILESLVALGYMLRGLGMILAGAGLYKTGFMQGTLSPRFYKRMALGGLGTGLFLATLGVVITHLGDYGRDVAFVGEIPNTLGTIPASLGYISLIILWQQTSKHAALKRRLIATGRMALTNYLSQTALGILVLGTLLVSVEVNRAGVFVFVLAVWALQLWWSPMWLNRFRFGPMEWLWRVGTYRRLQPFRR